MAFFQKYPNPYSLHVLSADILYRYVDGLGRLHSQRLLLKTGGSAVPSWLQSLIKSREAYVVEESVVDLEKGIMRTSTLNLSHRRFMSIEEIQTFSRSLDEPSSWYESQIQIRHSTYFYRSVIDTQAKFNCGLGRWTGIPGKLEGLGVNRFRDHLAKSRQSLKYVVEKLKISSSAVEATGSSESPR